MMSTNHNTAESTGREESKLHGLYKKISLREEAVHK